MHLYLRRRSPRPAREVKPFVRLPKTDASDAAAIAELTPSALVAFAGDARRFESARKFVAWLGLAPRVEASGGRTRIMGITKKGSEYLRRLLVHGARSRLCAKVSTSDPWLTGLLARRPRAVAITALAAKQARVAWALMVREEAYRPRPVAK